MNSTEIDGVPVLWADVPGPLTATLTFGVGGRDESLRTIGVTHMVEHLAMSALARPRHDHNASVDLEVTEFTAAGRPDQIVAFLRDVCIALSDLPTARLDTEAGVLTAENGHFLHPHVACLLRARYGARGNGLSYYAGPGYDRLTEHQVRRHVEQFFTADNAVLALSGPPPRGLTLPLPLGSRPSHPLPDMLEQAGPQWLPGPLPGAAVLLRGEACAAWVAAGGILSQRMSDVARHERGLSYDVDGGALLATAGARDIYLVLDARPGQDAAVAALIWTELNRLAGAGPTREELDREVSDYHEAAADPRWPLAELDLMARGLLFDLPIHPLPDRLEQLEALRPDDISRCLAQALPTALLLTGDNARLQLDGVSPGGCPHTRTAPSGRVYRPPALARAFSKQVSAHRLILTEDGVAHRDADENVHYVRFHEVVGVQSGDGMRLVFGANGCVIPVDLELFPSAQAVIRAVDAAVPRKLHFPTPDLH